MTQTIEAIPPGAPAITLSPLERGCEIVFGLLMTASFVTAVEISAGGTASAHDLLVTALGCNLAWGLIDGAMFLLQQQFGRFRNHRSVRELHELTDEAAFRARVRDELPPLIGPALTDDTYAAIRRVVQAPIPRRPAFWSGSELLAALRIWVLVAATTFPLVVPFMLIDNAWMALRVSNGVLVVMLFALGWWIGRWSGASPGRAGTMLAAIGVALSAACAALGG